MSDESSATARADLPTADEAEDAYNVLAVAQDVIEVLTVRVRRVAASGDGSELGLVVDHAAMGVVAAIAADVRLRAAKLSELAAELEAAIFDLDGIRRLQRDAA